MAGAAIGIAGTAAGITLVFLGMRAVMDIGGFCAEGGPYEIAAHCPDGATPALLLGMFMGMASAALGSAFGIRIGGIWATVPVLAWAGLFGSLGWNFMDYGLFNAPDGIELGWAIPGVMFWVMAAVPLLGVGSFLVAGGASKLSAGAGGTLVRLPRLLVNLLLLASVVAGVWLGIGAYALFTGV